MTCSCFMRPRGLAEFSERISELRDFLNGKNFTDQLNCFVSVTWNEQETDLPEGLDKKKWISLFHRAFQFTMCFGPTNALVCNKTLIQMSHIKTLKITPACFDHQLIIIRELLILVKITVDMPLHTIQHAKRMTVCCRIIIQEDSNFNQWF
jgi:hypothetical protein